MYLIKNSLNKEQYNLKREMYPDMKDFEVHLDKEYTKVTDLTSKLNFGKTELSDKVLQVFDGATIRSVHMPLFKGNSFYIEYTETQNVLPYIAKTADCIRKTQGSDRIIVVVHAKLTVYKMEMMGILNNVVSVLRDVADTYRQVDIAIENTLYDFDVNVTNYLANLELAEFVNRDNVGTCIDTCHLKICQYMYDIVKENYIDLDIMTVPSIDDMMRKNRIKVKLFHLTNASNQGTGYGMNLGHGSAFENTAEDKAYLKQFLESYNKYGLDCPMTLEIGEFDYMNPINLPKTLYTISQLE